MSRRTRTFPWRALTGLAAITSACALALSGVFAGPVGAPRALGQEPAAEVTPQTDAAVPAHEVVMLGASPKEAPGETWGIGKVGLQSASTWAIVRYTPQTGWQLAPPILDGKGQKLESFAPANSNIAGSITARGSGALLGEALTEKGARYQLLLVRNPGDDTFVETTSAPPLAAGESLFAANGNRAPLVAAIDEGREGEEGEGVAGALVVPIETEPVPEHPEESVLHWSGSSRSWTTERIELPTKSREIGGFRVLAIAASSPGNAWLLAQLQAGSDGVALFHRERSGGEEVWKPVSVSGAPAGAPLEVPLSEGKSVEYTVDGLGEPPTSQAQLLTVSEKGVWIDGRRRDTERPITMFFKPAAGGAGGTTLASWCSAGASTACTHTIEGELELPTGRSRSFAWAEEPSPFGERVITGLREGISLRLEGEVFKRVLALGASETVDVGASRGAAFSEPKEGWLGSDKLPVHLTVNPEEDLLQDYPTPFRHPLLAIAAQPEAPVGALKSEAVAVGEEGEVARYTQGFGWRPESLLNIAGVRQTPHLRAVAWPRGNSCAPGIPRCERVYAVGTEGAMWLYRGETGLWEKDPATPINFRGDLLGIAFDPEEPSRGYAVGQGGVLLRYGKTWVQEPVCEAGTSGACLPSELADASFTSIAFAGSEAIVAFRVPHFTVSDGETSFEYIKGGLLVNNGSGWHIDSGAEKALAVEPQDIPWAVAGLPDGGAAFSAETAGGVARVFERNSAGGSWGETAQPYPGYVAPGSLAIFREGGAVRVIGVGAAPDTNHADEQTPPPAGFPPAFVRPYPLAEPPAFMFRQTASGWSEEEHDHDELGPPPGNYDLYDKGYEPDPSWAMLISPTGNAGWAVGGFPRGESEAAFETADIARYAYPQAESATPADVGTEPVPTEPGTAVFAIGGGSQCGAPCAARANARIGPDVWLASALKRAHAIGGVRDFLYTGPRVTTGKTLVKATVQIPYGEEFARYAQLLQGGEGTPVYAAASATDVVDGSECLFETYLKQFFETWQQPCASGGAAYYAVRTPARGGEPAVRALVLDDSGSVDATQLTWLKTELKKAEAAEEPAIVIGSADLNAEEEEHTGEAAKVVETLVEGKASAYFFDAPEKNVKLTLHGSNRNDPIYAYGSGTLGYVDVLNAETPEFIGASGFLLAQVGRYEPPNLKEKDEPNAKVNVELVPDIGEGPHGEGELSLEAQQGTLLRRSEAAMFAALARRPRAGNEAPGDDESENLSYVFTPIPANCVGADCGRGVLPAYSFTSSNEEVGKFVQQELHSSEANAVKFNAKEEPVFEEHKSSPAGLVESASGLFCALNAGETTVTVSAGGFKASLVVKVEKGSVRRPCGTVPAKHKPMAEQQAAAPAPPPPAPSPAPAPASAPPVIPLPPPPPAPATPRPQPHARPPAPPTFFIEPALPALLIPFLPPPLVEPVNPTPPSGTSAVTSPVEAAQKEEEQEEATESVSNKATAYVQGEHEPSPAYLLGVIVLAAFAGASALRRPRRGRREVRVAPATVSTIRAQRRMGGRRP